MQLNGILDFLRAEPSYRALLDRLHSGSLPDGLGVLRAARPITLAALAHDWPGPVIYITARVQRAYNVAEQLPVWLGDRPVYRFAEPTPLFYERAPWGESVMSNRIETLSALITTDDFAKDRPHPVVVTSARAVMQRTLPVNQFRQATMALRRRQRHDIARLLQRWLGLGYEAMPIVIEPGTFSRRGGILDIFPLTADLPYRIEFFDDEIESLRQFDPSTQRSSAQVEQAIIHPAREVLPEHAAPLANQLATWFASLPTQSSDAQALASGTAFPLLEHYLPYVYPNSDNLLSYAPQNALLLVEDWDELEETSKGIEETSEQTRAERIDAGEVAPDYPLPYLGWDALQKALRERSTLHLDISFSEIEQPPDLAQQYGDLFVPEAHFGGQLKPLLSHVRALRSKGERIAMVTQQASRLSELWHEQEAFIPTANDVPEPPERGSLAFVSGALQEGWALRTGNGDLHLFTDAEIFGWNRPEPRRRKVVRHGRAPESSYADWREGDYVVHVDYGIGRFAGTLRRMVEGYEREYLLVEYAGNDRLFVPIHQADRLTRYVGPDETPPKVNRLGTPDWTRIKGRTKRAVEEEARELLELYAARARTMGHPFAADSPWQHELEASFPYVETEDQLRAVREVKADMEQSQPMDRLICGDVGYGKTEVALRAAFKAVTDGKQVVLLVPTTVLAQQHYETFSQRLAPFPLKVEVLSRFRTKEEQRQLLPRLASGEIDITIGTHRLLQEDVKLKNLGLVIIDEEQRFGVKHKEHFKRLRTQVDVLTLTATPIPRTLYMSLTGVRDISMIQTPPEERLPVITYVSSFDERVIRQAVLRELERGGQVFYVHNRVQTIEAARERLERIVPEARIGVAHGQTHARHLESVMARFSRGEYDVLVSTSIIESGLDIPNSNTLIVDRADWFGMAQLYQLRGRVGRSAQQAYAYFFHPGAQRLTPEAQARLETLAEHSTLGAGFQIAMRDLELRGAGDILSTRQSGHVAAVGLHLYTQLLAQAVKRLKGDGTAKEPTTVSESTVTIDLPLPAYLPADWIPEMALRLQLYRRVGSLTTIEEVDMIREELRDRFGPLPVAVEGLLYQIDVKLLAHAAGATAVQHQKDELLIKLPYLAEVDREKLEADLGDGVRVTRTAVYVPLNEELWQLHLLDVLSQLAEGVQEAVGA